MTKLTELKSHIFEPAALVCGSFSVSLGQKTEAATSKKAQLRELSLNKRWKHTGKATKQPSSACEPFHKINIYLPLETTTLK